jgi:hypothetical protein
MADDKNKDGVSRYKPDGFEESFPTDMGEDTMQVASLVQLGREAYNDENFNLAMKYFNRALDMDPSNKEAKFLKRKTMLNLTRLLEGKTKVEDDEEVDKELGGMTSKHLSGMENVTDEELNLNGRKISSVPIRKGADSKREKTSVYSPPPKDFRKGGSRVYSIPDTDKKFNNNAKKVAYRSGDSLVETRETRYLFYILAAFIIGVLGISIYFGWIPI